MGVVAFGAIVTGSSSRGDGGGSPAAEARRLQAEYKRAGTAPEKQRIAEALLALGPEGGRRLHGIARADLLQRQPRYAASFQRGVARLLDQRRGTGDPTAEIESLRRTIRDVAAAADLSREMIEARSDPAIERLQELLLVPPADVLAADPALAAEREELLALAAWAERAAALVPENDRARLPRVDTRAEAAARLDAADALAAVSALPISPADRQALAANATLARDLDPEEVRGILRLNEIRILVGLPVQAIDPGLVTACRVHSQDMATRGFFAHESPVAGRESPWKRAQAAGTSASAENIAAGADTGEAAILMWWHSPGHHKNMLGDQKRTGLGRYEGHWTQLFG